MLRQRKKEESNKTERWTREDGKNTTRQTEKDENRTDDNEYAFRH